MKHLKKAFCLLLAAVMLLALGVPVMAAGEIPVDAEHFPDAALRTYVTDYCDTNKDNKLSAAECEAVQCIDLFEMKITKVADMTGIEHFTNLHELIACSNQITTLDLSGKTLLIAEDNEINAEILQSLLEMQGASCTICRDGVEVVEKFRTVVPGEYDAILMDVQMPGMDGYEATRTIRSGANPLGRTIPIIAMTANAFAEDVKKSLDAGMNAHLSKPVDLNALEQTLQRFRYEPSAEQPQ